MQILLVDESVMILVDHVEGLLEFGDLRLIEHGKDIRGGPLRPLLRGTTTAHCLSGRHFLQQNKRITVSANSRQYNLNLQIEQLHRFLTFAVNKQVNHTKIDIKQQR